MKGASLTLASQLQTSTVRAARRVNSTGSSISESLIVHVTKSVGVNLGTSPPASNFTVSKSAATETDVILTRAKIATAANADRVFAIGNALSSTVLLTLSRIRREVTLSRVLSAIPRREKETRAAFRAQRVPQPVLGSHRLSSVGFGFGI